MTSKHLDITELYLVLLYFYSLVFRLYSNNMHIISKTKSYEEKEFYLKLASKEKYKAKELARQIDSGYYERLLLSNGKASSAIESKDMTGVL